MCLTIITYKHNELSPKTRFISEKLYYIPYYYTMKLKSNLSNTDFKTVFAINFENISLEQLHH